VADERGAPPVLDDGETSGAVAATQALFTEVVGLFHRLRILADQLHGQDGMTTGLRSILFELDRSGPRTVPQMARARPVARQHIQGLVDQLRERRLVELKDNPAHRRSHLVRLTDAGRALVEGMNRRETDLLSGLQIPVRPGNLQTATEVLKAVREFLANPDVHRVLAGTGPEAPPTESVRE
jgi:DNA-binding MarR family transcriptional regulator